ncbi:DUF6953 family protein [Rhodococcus sp. NPDC004095]
MTHTAKDIASWMVEQIKAEEAVYQEHIVHEITEKFGEEWEHANERGNPAIHPTILREFGKLKNGEIEWERGDRRWVTTN